MKKYIAALLLGLAACTTAPKPKAPSTEVTFAPYQAGYATKVDFAEVEHEYPLSIEARMKLTPEILKTYDQEQVDQIYARLTAGPIPDGPYDGDLFFPKGQSGKSRLGEILGGIPGQAANFELDKLSVIGRALWKGKVFYRTPRLLRNRIDHLEFLEEFFPNEADKKKLRELVVHGHKDALYFPAKLYCGQSLLDSRRESVIIDYAFTDDIEGYEAVPDKLAGREGVLVRDEIRMIRPGFYLGRAYLFEGFGLNFTVYNADVDKAQSAEFQKTGKVAEDCEVGYQALAQAQTK
jgi:hypothetical protein